MPREEWWHRSFERLRTAGRVFLFGLPEQRPTPFAVAIVRAVLVGIVVGGIVGAFVF